LYPGSVAGAQPWPGAYALVGVGEDGWSAALKRARVARYTSWGWQRGWGIPRAHGRLWTD